jgi:hypothetical protein
VKRLTVLASYPKSGNTWLRAFIDSLRSGAQDVNINGNMAGICPAADRAMFDQCTQLKSADLGLGEIVWTRPDVWRRVVNTVPSPPWIKTHDALLQPHPKAAPMFPSDVIGAAVYIVRDPRDVAISFAHHFAIDIDAAIECLADEQLFLDLAQVPPSQQLPQFVSSWSKHVASWLDAPDIKRLVVRYEDMHAKPPATFGAVARFLGLDASPDAIDRAMAASRFDLLRAQEDREGFRESDPTTVKFFRNGKAAGWRDVLTGVQVAQIARDHGEMMRRLGYR